MASASISGNIFQTSDTDFNGTPSQTAVSGSGTGASVVLSLSPPQTYNFTGSTNDGYVYGNNSSYSTTRSTSNTFNTIQTTLPLGQYWNGVNYLIYRNFLKFDTSAIPDTDTITQVNLKMVCTQYISNTDFDVNIIKQNWSAQDPIDATNKEAAYDNGLTSAEDNNIWRNTSGMSINTQYASGNLDTTWVNKTGSTYYSLASNRDYDGSGTTPTGWEYILIASQDNATEAYRPILTVLARAYYSSGTYTSSIFQRAQVASWGNLTYNATLNNQGLGIKVRTCSQANCSDGTAWGSCGTINSGDSLKMASPNCVSDSQKYIQYQANFTSDTTNTAYLNDITLDYLYNPDTTTMSGFVKFFGSITFK